MDTGIKRTPRVLFEKPPNVYFFIMIIDSASKVEMTNCSIISWLYVLSTYRM